MGLVRHQQHTRDPIRWSPDRYIVENILAYCQREYYRKANNRYKMARNEILARIYGNLQNVVRRAYPSEISFETVERELTKHCNDSPADQAQKAGLVTALESEWGRMREIFQRDFIRKTSEN